MLVSYHEQKPIHDLGTTLENASKLAFLIPFLSYYWRGIDTIMKQVLIKTLVVCIVVLLLPYLLTLFISSNRVKKHSIEAMNFKINYERNGRIDDLDLDTYIMGVVAANMPAGYHVEALKTQAVIARTYALYNMALLTEEGHLDEAFTTWELGIPYIEISEMKPYWGDTDYSTYYTKIENAVRGTTGKILVHDGELVLPLFFETGTGYTRNAIEALNIDIPYLTSVESSQDVTSINYLKISEYYIPDLINLLENHFPGAIISDDLFFDEIKVTERDSTGYIKTINLGNHTITGEEFAKALGLNSYNFTIEQYNGNVRVVCKGVGHGIGLSQYGSNAMAREGYLYNEILSHYYIGTELISIE